MRGHIIDGVFDGIIHSKQGTYHIEKAHKFFDGSQDFHSIIYHSEAVRIPESATSCGGVKGKLIQQLNELASTAVPLRDKKLFYGEDRHSRLKRQTISNNRFCPVRVAADHLYLANVGGGSVVNTMSQIASIIADVQEIFSMTRFSGNPQPDLIQPVIVSLEVLDENDRGYRFGADNIAVDDFLDLWSQEDQSEFCLALLLTHRDFADGVLGLAWVAQSAGGNSGGICEDRVVITTGERSLNTGIVTFLNFGQTQPTSVATVTIAHEWGHNFGSPVSIVQTPCVLSVLEPPSSCPRASPSEP
jgi:disintegrin and metalloproteinase domain-containing protein 10